LIRALATLPHRLFSGMALEPVRQTRVLQSALTSEEKNEMRVEALQRRSKEACEAKLAYESNRIVLEMAQNAEKYWGLKWSAEVQTMDAVEKDSNDVSIEQPPLSDAERHALREAARPSSGGCKCGSSDHTFVNSPKCPLYRDIRHYCVNNSIPLPNFDKKEKDMLDVFLRMKNAKSAREKAYIDRFIRLREGSEAAKEEAAFVFEMEKIQSCKMKKAVLLAAPNDNDGDGGGSDSMISVSLCTLVLSAVASLMDRIREEGPEIITDDPKMISSEKRSAEHDGASKQQENCNTGSEKSPVAPNQRSTNSESDSDDDDSDSDDSDEEDLPLNSLLLQKRIITKQTKPNFNSPPPSKRLKQTPSAAAKASPTPGAVAPSPYFLAEILKCVSATHGHLFQEPSHAEFAWQQRHRSTLTSPLPKEVMFAGNPRTPGSLSFENICFELNTSRMSRLRDTWGSPAKQQKMQEFPLLQYKQTNSSQQNNIAAEDKCMIESWNDEWIVTHLASDAMTGLRHELDVLHSLGILSITANGKVVLSEGWEKRTPQMILQEMKHAWGAMADAHNLFCIHDGMRKALESTWENVDGSWQLALPSKKEKDMIDDEKPVLDEDEYQLRKQIFIENYNNWVSEKNGMGDFGV